MSSLHGSSPVGQQSRTSSPTKQNVNASARASFSGLLSQLENLSESTPRRDSKVTAAKGRDALQRQPVITRAASRALLDAQMQPDVQTSSPATLSSTDIVSENAYKPRKPVTENASKIRKIEKWQELESLLPNIIKKQGQGDGGAIAPPMRKSTAPSPIMSSSIIISRNKNNSENFTQSDTDKQNPANSTPITSKKSADKQDEGEKDNSDRSKALDSISSLVSLRSGRINKHAPKKETTTVMDIEKLKDDLQTTDSKASEQKRSNSGNEEDKKKEKENTSEPDQPKPPVSSTTSIDNSSIKSPVPDSDNSGNLKPQTPASPQPHESGVLAYPLGANDKKEPSSYEIIPPAKNEATSKVKKLPNMLFEKNQARDVLPVLHHSITSSTNTDQNYTYGRSRSISLASIQGYNTKSSCTSSIRLISDLVFSLGNPVLSITSFPPTYASEIKENFLPNKGFSVNNFSPFNIQDANEKTLEVLITSALKDSEVFLILDNETYQQRKIGVIEACGDVVTNHSHLKQLSDKRMSFIDAYLTEVKSSIEGKEHLPKLPSPHMIKKIETITESYLEIVGKLWESISRLVNAQKDVLGHMCATMRYSYFNKSKTLSLSGSINNQKSPLPPAQIEKEIYRLRKILKKDQASLSEVGKDNKILSLIKTYLSIVDKISLSIGTDETPSLSKTASSATDDSSDTEEYSVVNNFNNSPKVPSLPENNTSNIGTPISDRQLSQMQPVIVSNTDVLITSASSRTLSSTNTDSTRFGALKDLYSYLCYGDNSEDAKAFSVENLVDKVKSLNEDFHQCQDELSAASRDLHKISSKLAPSIAAVSPDVSVSSTMKLLEIVDLISKVTDSITNELKETRSCLLEREYEVKSVKETLESMDGINKKNISVIKSEDNATIEQRDNTIKSLEAQLSEAKEQVEKVVVDLESHKEQFAKDKEQFAKEMSENVSKIQLELSNENSKSMSNLISEKDGIIMNGQNQVSELHKQLEDMQEIVRGKEATIQEMSKQIDDTQNESSRILTEKENFFENEIKALNSKLVAYESDYIHKNDVHMKEMSKCNEIETFKFKLSTAEAEINRLKELNETEDKDTEQQNNSIKKNLVDISEECNDIKSKNAALEKELQTLRLSLETSEKNLVDTRNGIAQTEKELYEKADNLQGKVRKIEKELSDVNSEKKKALSTISDLTSKLQKLEKKLAETQQKLEKEKENVSTLTKDNKQIRKNATTYEKDMEKLTVVLMDQKEKNVMILEEIDDYKVRETFLQDKIRMLEEQAAAFTDTATKDEQK